MTTTIHNDSAERFSVSTEGMAQLHRDREPWYLVKELVANAWDEGADTDVIVQATESGVTVSVEDDGTGFANIEDAYTLMRPTPKRGKPDVRGRFNVGEKEIFSIASHGSVETVGYTVNFPEGGGREVLANDRTQGTMVTATVSEWGRDEAAGIVDMLNRFRPPADLRYTVNGRAIGRVQPQSMPRENLESVIQSSPGEPMRRTNRNTHVEIIESIDSKGWLYEMGIPVQPLNCPYHVDVMQKVPMNQNRDSAPERYLRDLYAIVLNATYANLTEDQASRGWVMAATEDERAKIEAIMKVFSTRFGEGAVIKSRWDTEANERAIESGLTLVPTSALSPAEKNRFKDAGVSEAHARFGLVSNPTETVKHITEGMKQVEGYAHWLAELVLGHDISVTFIRTSKDIAADYSASMSHLRFNLTRIGGGAKWFDGPISERHTDLILHELAHDAGSDLAHHGSYVHLLSAIGAKAVHRALALGVDSWGESAEVDTS
jgi:hypothetical protein